MVITGGAKVAGAAPMPRAYPQLSYSAVPAQTQKVELARRFDSVSISGEAEKSKFAGLENELKTKLSQEIRSSEGLETVQALREQVQQGVYRIDPGAIARKMLLMGETGE